MMQPIPMLSPYTLPTTTSSVRSVKKVIKKDKEGNVIHVTEFDAWGRVTYFKGKNYETFSENTDLAYSYEYDNFGNVTHYHDHITGYQFWKEYDNYGNVVYEKDTNGVEETYEIEYFPIPMNSIFYTYSLDAKVNDATESITSYSPQQSFAF
jgi:hypothetical protein